MARYALVIGVGENRSPLPSLSKTVGDAIAIAEALETQGDFRVDCRTLPEQLTQAALSKSIKQFVNQKAKTAEVALIYYTGHAVPVVDGFAEETEVFLAPVDCGVTRVGDRCTAQQNGISLQSLSSLLAKADLKNLVMLLDCCHSGALTEPAALDQTFAGFRSKNYWLLTSCRSFEQSWAKKGDSHSLFSGAVLRGLAIGQADDRGEITAGKLFGFVTEELRQARQEPQQVSVGGSVIVARYRQSVVVAGVDESIEPYQGLSAFTPETKRFFFGRDGVVLELLRKLQASNFVPVIGPSGIGKSSIVRAGLIPRLLEQGWRILGPIKPGPEPIGELKRSFRELFPGRRLAWVYEQVEAGNLGAVVAELPEGQFLLVIDQFEEVFTLCPRLENQRRFVEPLVAIGDQSDSRLAIVMTMRSDFVNDWLATGQPPQVMQDQTVMVGPLRGDDLRDAIVKPAEQLGYGFGEGLLELVLADVEAEPNCLPLLGFALAELWQRRDRQRRVLTAAAYREMGSLRGSLNVWSEAFYGSLQAVEQDWIRRICLQLVRVGKGENDTRQRRLKSELLAMGTDEVSQRVIEDVIGELVRGRLLVTDSSESGATIDLAHEALMTAWERFEEWRQGDRNQWRLRQRIEDAYEEWIDQGNSNDYLLSSGLINRLQGLEQEKRNELLVTANFQDFFRLSTQYQERANAFRYSGMVAAIREKTTEILELPANQILDQTIRVIATIGESLEQLGEVIKPLQDSLIHVSENIYERLKLEGHTDAVFCVAFSPGGDCMVSGSADATLRLWDLEGKQIGKPFQGHSAGVRTVAFSPDGEKVVSGSSDGTLRLWDLNGIPIGEPFQGHLAGVLSIAFSPCGNRIVSGSIDATLKLWDLDGWVIQSFYGHSDRVFSVAFNPTGELIVSASDDCTLRLWNLDGVQIGEPFQGHSDGVLAAAFSPLGDRIVSGSADATLRFWDLDGAQISELFQGHSDSVLSVAFNPSGDRIVSGSYDGTLRLWDLQDKESSLLLEGHSDGVLSVAFSPLEKHIISGSYDCTLRLWKLSGKVRETEAIGEAFQGHSMLVSSVDFSPQGYRIVSGSDDNTLRLWDLEGRRIGEPFQGHSDSVLAVAFSPQGDRIISGSDDNTLRLWDLEGSMIGEPFQGHLDSVWAVAFSPQGDRIVSGSRDNTLRLWDLKGGMIGKPFRGHSSSVLAVAFSPQGARIISGSDDNTLRLWDLEGSMIGEPFQSHLDSVWAVAFSPQGDRIVSGSRDNTLRLWDLKGGMIGKPFRGHSSSVLAVAFSSQGDRIVSGSVDKTLRLWDLGGRMIGEPFQGHSSSVSSVAFSPSGDSPEERLCQRIVSGSHDKTLRLWRGGGWRDWLHDCCTKLMFHSDLVSPTTDFARQACQVCQDQAWTRPETARFLRAQAHALQRQGKPEEEAAKLAEAQRLDPI
jgi:WD40 repeat protein